MRTVFDTAKNVVNYFSPLTFARYICSMEENTMTLIEAWTDFCVWAFSPEMFHTFTVDNRRYFNKTSKDIEAGSCGAKRVKNIFAKFAPGRYEVFETVVFKRTKIW